MLQHDCTIIVTIALHYNFFFSFAAVYDTAGIRTLKAGCQAVELLAFETKAIYEQIFCLLNYSNISQTHPHCSPLFLILLISELSRRLAPSLLLLVGSGGVKALLSDLRPQRGALPVGWQGAESPWAGGGSLCLIGLEEMSGLELLEDLQHCLCDAVVCASDVASLLKCAICIPLFCQIGAVTFFTAARFPWWLRVNKTTKLATISLSASFLHSCGREEK